MANLQDVARAANVSKTTVSRYLNGSLELPARTAEAIDTAIRTLNYSPNPHARRLSLGRSDTIALVVPDIATPFFATFVAAVEAEADARGLSLALHATLNRPDRELKYLDHIRQGHADGLIFITNHAGSRALAEKVNSGGPCVVVDEDIAEARVPKLFCDNAEGGRLAGRRLARAGHRHVLFIGGVDQMISGARRYAGFLEGMREIAGPDVRIERSCGPYTFEAGRAAAQAFVARGPDRPTAIFATSDELTIGLYEVLREAGLSIPRDVSVVGFDDVGPLHLFAPAVTAVRQPVRDLGRRALELLLAPPPVDPERLPPEELLPVTLIERESVAPPVGQTRRNTNSED
ncbi:LacI family DNA-binding transcriptional regulator [Rhodobacter sphaeroides]|jgi:LacI family transcriptional regulator|uniref:Transcriptional regulator, LacI family n=2 Tax=Cereibacter sphaeroides TaxID=1063 RepID=Q3IVY8_CERS4|nr:LacI family DNA-binding transcriptional regulator [Cereibacter sphaeroides]ABN78514.1 transcriptional regulator, LacI family [Cereibacter sphaeroides ATCC 17029]ABA81296.1 transcriptional regulator, LacI family [Cereibacter sphaeroides 2.4.1]ACM03781.1 Transcriptional regulator, LacI family [Cereibacter sphaeroides KD131]AMJ49590.1 transcriptional regulator [Cereibacter sphaeroides]ANS36304.1 transcriptional regulator [Cereibacter sphaeroides]